MARKIFILEIFGTINSPLVVRTSVVVVGVSVVLISVVVGASDTDTRVVGASVTCTVVFDASFTGIGVAGASVPGTIVVCDGSATVGAVSVTDEWVTFEVVSVTGSFGGAAGWVVSATGTDGTVTIGDRVEEVPVCVAPGAFSDVKDSVGVTLVLHSAVVMRVEGILI